MKRYLLTLRHSPYINTNSLEILELAQGIASFEQDVGLLFMGDGIYNLLTKQKAYIRDFTKEFTNLDLFDIENTYIEQSALEQRNYSLQDLLIKPQILSNTEIHNLFDSYDIIL